MAERGKAVRASMTSDLKASDLVGQVFPVEHVVVVVREWADNETGEISDRIITTLVSPAGDRLATQSKMAAQNLATICTAFGPPPWRPALPLKLTEVKGGKFGRYYVLEPA